MKNLTDFRQTVETGVDSPMVIQMVRRDPVTVLDDRLVTRVGQNKMKTGETHSRHVSCKECKWKEKIETIYGLIRDSVINVFPNQMYRTLQIFPSILIYFWEEKGKSQMKPWRVYTWAAGNANCTCVFLLCRQHTFQWVLFHVLSSLHLHQLLWLF